MDITLGELNKLPIKRLKEILKKLAKEPKNAQVLTTIEIIRSLIIEKKNNGLILHPGFIKGPNGIFRETRCKSVNAR